MDKTELIKNTFEYRFYKTRFITCILMIPIIILMTVISFFSPETEMIVFPLSILVVFYAFFLAFDIKKLRSFLSSSNVYDVLNATATGAHNAFGMGKGRMYLDLEITTADGGVIHTETKGVYSRSIISDQYYKNFVGNNFRVLYDRTTSTVLIINE